MGARKCVCVCGGGYIGIENGGGGGGGRQVVLLEKVTRKLLSVWLFE